MKKVSFNPYVIRSINEIVDYIAVGRSKVKGTELDPYRSLINSHIRVAIYRDAKKIWDWYKKLSSGKDAAGKNIVAIQHGPEVRKT